MTNRSNFKIPRRAVQSWLPLCLLLLANMVYGLYFTVLIYPDYDIELFVYLLMPWSVTFSLAAVLMSVMRPTPLLQKIARVGLWSVLVISLLTGLVSLFLAIIVRSSIMPGAASYFLLWLFLPGMINGVLAAVMLRQLSAALRLQKDAVLDI